MLFSHKSRVQNVQPRELLSSDGRWLHVCKTNYGQSFQENAGAVEVSMSCEKSDNTQASKEPLALGVAHLMLRKIMDSHSAFSRRVSD